MLTSSTSTHSNRPVYIFAALCGILGAVSLSVSFSINPGPPAGATIQQIIVWGQQVQGLIRAGAWLQAFGSLLEVIFMLALIYLANATKRLSSMIIAFTATAIMSVSLIEIAGYLSAIQSGVNGDLISLRMSLILIQAIQHAYVIAPAPANLLALGVLLLNSHLLPRIQLRIFAAIAIILGAVVGVMGLIGTFIPMQTQIDMALTVQEVWFIATSIALLIASRKLVNVSNAGEKMETD